MVMTSHRLNQSYAGVQVPTKWSIMGAALIIGCTLALGLFENAKKVEVPRGNFMILLKAIYKELCPTICCNILCVL